MKYFQRLLVGSIVLVTLSVSAQWQWTDKDGRKVFSDRPPPADIQDKNIIKRPGNRVIPPDAENAGSNTSKSSAGTTAASAAQGASSAPKPSGVDKELAENKKKAEEAELAKRKAEEGRILKARVENCARAKQAKTSFDSGVRIARTNEKGEREIMDDATRAAEAKRIQSIIDSDCR